MRRVTRARHWKVLIAVSVVDATSGVAYGQSATAPAPNGARAAFEIAANPTGAVACLREQGLLRCWGSNRTHQIADSGEVRYRRQPTPVAGIAAVTDVAIGDYWTCVVHANSEVSCWGESIAASAPPGPSHRRIVLRGAEHVAVGQMIACAVMRDHTVSCWGRNNLGTLGDGTQIDRDAPATVNGLRDVAEVGIGGNHVCARHTDGTVSCWGSIGSLVPQRVPGLRDVTGLAVVNDTNCALLRDGTVQCWGNNVFGELGDGSDRSSATPAAVPGVTAAVQVDAASGYACVRHADGRVSCWGDNRPDRVDGATPASLRVASPVRGLRDVRALALGDNFACAVRGGGLWCWGANLQGERAQGTPLLDYSSTPIAAALDPARACRPNCAGRRCGDDQCGGLCGRVECPQPTRRR